MKSWKSIKWIAILIIIIVVIIGMVKTCKEASRNLKNMETAIREDPGTASKILPLEYLSLATKKYRDSMFVDIVHYSKAKGRNPVALVEFDKKYQLYIYKIDLVKDTSLQKIFFTKAQPSEQEVGITYTFFENNLYDFMTESGTVPKVSAIYFYYDADSINTVIKNDSVISYNVSANDLSVRYAKEQTEDIFMVSKNSGFFGLKPISIDILFFKRNGAVYLLTMCADDPNEEIAPDLLYKVIMGGNVSK